MLISYSRPESISWSLAGTGASFLTDAARLTNGRPESGTRVQWLSGAQTTSSRLDIRASWPQGSVIRMCGLVGVTLPTGTKIACSLRRAADSGFDYLTLETRVVRRLDGARVAWFAFDATEESIGAEFAIFNDVNGVASIAADSVFDVGEAWIGQGATWCIRPQYESGRNDLSKMVKSIGGQPYPVRRRADAVSQIEVSPVLYGQAFGAQGSIEDIRERLLAFEPCVVVSIASEPFKRAPVDPAIVNQRSEFGYCGSAGPIKGEAPRWVFSAQFTAPPALRP